MSPDLFSRPKPIIAMAHLAALPGAPGYHAGRGIKGLIDVVARDIDRLQAGGVDAILFGNEGDRPYVLQAPAEGLAAMSAIVATLKPMLKVPFGVDYLWDPYATVALAVATGASFAREVFTGVYAADMGMWQPDCAGALRLRARLGREDLKLLFNVNAEFATPLDGRPIERRAQSAVFSSLADAICVSGPLTGQPVDQLELRRVKAVLANTPVFANTGVDIDNVASILEVADGCVIGTHFKVDGDTWSPVDGDRVKRFMDRVAELR
jgi:membrane complex biogenesis BtpA family protein